VPLSQTVSLHFQWSLLIDARCQNRAMCPEQHERGDSPLASLHAVHHT